MTRERLAVVLQWLSLAGIVLLAWLVLRGWAGAQEPIAVVVEADALAGALEHELAVWERRDGSIVYVAHCRSAPGGCEARVRSIAVELVRAARAHRVDPWLLAAMALRESGLNPEAVGAIGEVGVLQLHPRSAHGQRARAACRRAPGRCGAAVIWIAAEHLAAVQAICGSEGAALGAYNRGECGETTYSRRVLRRRDGLRRVARGDGPRSAAPAVAEGSGS